MRVSGTCFARIQDDEGRYVNKGRLDRGKGRILSPIGGGIELEPAGRRFLAGLGATDFEQGSDLRCRVPDDQVAAIISWFSQRSGRETTTLREMAEELTKETGILVLRDLVGTIERLRGFHRFDDVTVRDVPEKQTVYLIEVFDVVLGLTAMAKLIAASVLPQERRWLHFVTPDEIEAGLTAEDVAIGQISKHLLA